MCAVLLSLLVGSGAFERAGDGTISLLRVRGGGHGWGRCLWSGSLYFLSGDFRSLSFFATCRHRRLFRFATTRNCGNVIFLCIRLPSVFAHRSSFFVRRTSGVCLIRLVLFPFACVWNDPSKLNQFKGHLQGLMHFSIFEGMLKCPLLNVRSGVYVSQYLPANDASVAIHVNFLICKEVMVRRVLGAQGVRSANNGIYKCRCDTATITRLMGHAFTIKLLRASVGRITERLPNFRMPNGALRTFAVVTRCRNKVVTRNAGRIVRNLRFILLQEGGLIRPRAQDGNFQDGGVGLRRPKTKEKNVASCSNGLQCFLYVNNQGGRALFR